MSPHGVLTGWSSWWWPFLAAHLWQSTLFLVAAALAVLLLRNASAGARHGAWLICSLKFAVPALLLATPLGWLGLNSPNLVPYVTRASVIEEWIGREPSAVGGQPSAFGGVPSPNHGELYCVLSLIWVAGLMFFGSRWYRSSRRLARLVRKSRTPPDPTLLAALDQATRTLGFRRRVGLVACTGISSPAAFGIFKPVIVVPSDVTAVLTRSELETVLMHELVHIRRWDNAIAAFHRLLCWFFWFYPLVWFLDRRLLWERELSCDQAVVASGGQPRAYIAGILKICKFSLTASPAGVSLASGSSLGRRIRMITRERSQRTRSSHRLVVAGLVCALVLFSAALAPQAAEDSSAPELRVGTCTACPVALLEVGVKPKSGGAEALTLTIRVRNDEDRAVQHFYLVLENPAADQMGYFWVTGPLQPAETRTVEVRAERVSMAVTEGPHNFRMERVSGEEARRRLGDLSQVEAKIPVVVFADDSSFALKGYLPPPPPPPPAPPAAAAPPAPPAPSDRGTPPALPEIPAPPAPPPAPPVPPDYDEGDGG